MADEVTVSVTEVTDQVAVTIATGDKGDTGEGVPAGGTAGQALTKIDSTDYNTQWSTGAGDGDVVGPAGVAADSNIAVYDGTTGKLLKDGSQTIAEVIAAAGTPAHNDTTGKQGGTTAEYYHLTAAQHTIAAASTASYTTAEETKLSGIEASADVTDTANVTAAGALMDSEVDADIKTLSLPANTTISAYGATLVDDADAGTARATLGLGSIATKNAIGSDELTDFSYTSPPTSNNFLVGDGSYWTETTAANTRTALDVDQAGTDNSTDVTLAGSLDYLTITGQQITRNAIVLTTDVSGTLPIANGGTSATTAAGAASALGLGTEDSPQFTAVNIGHASDTTLARVSAGIASIEGKNIQLASGTTALVELGFAAGDESTAISADTGVLSFVVPFDMTLTSIYSSLVVTPSTTAVQVDINDAGTTLLNAVISFATSATVVETTTFTGSASSYALSKGDVVTVDIDQGDAAAAGLKITFKGYRT